MAAADDDVLLTADDAQIALPVQPTEIAGHEPAMRVKRRRGGRRVVEIAEHQAGAAAADLADLARRSLDVRIVLPPDANLEALAGPAAGVDDALGRIVGEGVLVRAGFG